MWTKRSYEATLSSLFLMAFETWEAVSRHPVASSPAGRLIPFHCLMRSVPFRAA
ncbi:MAG: hypothetical protein WBC70_04050 [Candidatus Aminicenantales bacterium]